MCIGVNFLLFIQTMCVYQCTCEDVYQKKFVQSKCLLYFGKYGYGGHVDIKCKSFNVPLIRFQMKRQIEVQKCHIFCSKLLSKIFLVNIFAGTVSWADWLFFSKVSSFFFKCKNGFKKIYDFLPPEVYPNITELPHIFE